MKYIGNSRLLKAPANYWSNKTRWVPKNSSVNEFYILFSKYQNAIVSQAIRCDNVFDIWTPGNLVKFDNGFERTKYFML